MMIWYHTQKNCKDYSNKGYVRQVRLTKKECIQIK